MAININRNLPISRSGLEIWRFLKDKFNNHIDSILLYVLESKGSSPGRRGFKMAVAADNTFCGTIGGGIMEHKFVEMAKERLRNPEDDSEMIYRQVHDKSASKNQSGMICSGEQTIFLHKVGEKDIRSIRELINSIMLNLQGSLILDPTGINFSNVPAQENFIFEKQNENDFILMEKTGFHNELHIIGGGHCSLALSKLMADLEFFVVVYDEREGLNTMLQNDYAGEKIFLNSYSELSDRIPGGENVYVVLMTFGYRTDDLALRALVNKPFKYFGMLGSQRKVEKMFTQYRMENMDENFLRNIHAPVGVQIKSQTAAEIAVSIAAEIIAVKNKDQ